MGPVGQFPAKLTKEEKKDLIGKWHDRLVINRIGSGVDYRERLGILHFGRPSMETIAAMRDSMEYKPNEFGISVNSISYNCGMGEAEYRTRNECVAIATDRGQENNAATGS